MSRKFGKVTWRLIIVACLLAAGAGFVSAQAQSGGTVYIPLVFEQGSPDPAPDALNGVPLVHVPRFDSEIRFQEMAIFWFGEITPSQNYAEIRIGYNSQEFYVNVGVIDRLLWYDETPERDKLTQWDAVSVYLQPSKEVGEQYRMDSQLNTWEERAPYQAAFRLTSQGWTPASFDFTTWAVYRGEGAPNKDADNDGWVTKVRVPFSSIGFSSLGFSGEPPEGTVWRMGVVLHDRDNSSSSNPPKVWPAGFSVEDSETWAKISFGMPVYNAPSIQQTGKAVIRHKLDGQVVTDGEVGGGSTCAEAIKPNFFAEWGIAAYPGEEHFNSDFNIQNQSNIDDWPCFAKYYVTFPLDSVPDGAEVISARLTLHQFGNSGAPGEAKPSYIQVFRIQNNWNEASLTWNSAPHAQENVSAAWVDPILIFPGWPGVPRDWDLSRAVSENVRSDLKEIRLALYTAEDDFHSGRYFVSSETGDWNEVARPTLEIIYGVENP